MSVDEGEQRDENMNGLLLKVVLTGTASFAAGESAFVVALAGMYASMAREMTTGSKRFLADTAYVFLLTRSLRENDV